MEANKDDIERALRTLSRGGETKDYSEIETLLEELRELRTARSKMAELMVDEIRQTRADVAKAGRDPDEREGALAEFLDFASDVFGATSYAVQVERFPERHWSVFTEGVLEGFKELSEGLQFSERAARLYRAVNASPGSGAYLVGQTGDKRWAVVPKNVVYRERYAYESHASHEAVVYEEAKGVEA